MKKILISAGFLALATFLGFDFAGGIDSFTAQPDTDGITLHWTAEIETGISRYTVQRESIASTNDFQDVGTVAPTGSYSNYTFQDTHLSSIAQGGNGGGVQPLSDAYKYRLEIDLASGDVSYSTTVSVTKPSSGVRRTWGMIKEMFH